MGNFDRSKYRKTTLEAVQETENKVKETQKFFGGSSNYAKFFTVKDGRNEFRVLPAHTPDATPYVPIRTATVKCMVEVYENGEATGRKELKNKKVFIATTHSSVVKKDPIETYISYVYKLADEQFQDKKEKEKFLNPVNGYRAAGQWIPGIKPTSGTVCYCLQGGEIGRLELKSTWLKAMREISANKTSDEVLQIDIFSDPDEGFPLLIDKSKDDGKTNYKVWSLDIAKGQTWEEFYAKYRISDDVFAQFETLPTLKEMYVDVYTKKDFAFAIEGIERFDKEHGYNIFSDDQFLNELEEISDSVPEDKVQEETEEPSNNSSSKKTSAPKKNISISKMKEYIREYIEDNYPKNEMPVFDSEEEVEEWYNLALNDKELPFEEAPKNVNLNEMSRSQLKEYILEHELDIRVKKDMTEKDIVEAINAAINDEEDESEEEEYSSNDDPIEEDEEANEEDASSALEMIRRKRQGKK